jgi:hypothetical protein
MQLAAETTEAVAKTAWFNSSVDMSGEDMKKGVWCHGTGDAAFLVAGVQQYLRAAMG